MQEDLEKLVKKSERVGGLREISEEERACRRT